MKKSGIIYEIERRVNGNNDGYELIGPELKRRRTSQSQTLSSVASDVCSVSYLCKVERNQLKPNKHMLREICKRLNIEAPKMNVLFHMHQIMINCMIAYSNSNIDEIDHIYSKVKDFDNYKTQIIRFIYLISHKEFDEASELGSELLKIMNTMKDVELSIFSLFYSIFLYFKGDYDEAIDNLSSLYKLEKNECILYLIELYLFYCYFKISHPYTIRYGELLLKYYYDKTNIYEVEAIRYYLGVFYVINGLLDDAYKQLEFIKTEEYITNLSFLLDVWLKKKSKCDCSKLRPMMKLLYYHFYVPSGYREEFRSLSKNDEYELDFSYNIASYYAINDEKEKYRELFNSYIPSIIKSGNKFEREFFLGEFCKSCINHGRYKAFVMYYAELIEKVDS